MPLGLYRCHGRRSRTWQGTVPRGTFCGTTSGGGCQEDARGCREDARGCLGDGGADTRFPVCQQPRPRDTLPPNQQKHSSQQDKRTAIETQEQQKGSKMCHWDLPMPWEAKPDVAGGLSHAAHFAENRRTSGDSPPIGFLIRKCHTFLYPTADASVAASITDKRRKKHHKKD